MCMAEYVAGRRKDITAKHIDLFAGLLYKDTGKRLSLPYGMCAGRDYNWLWIKKADKNILCDKSNTTKTDIIDIKVPGRVELEYNDGQKHIILFKREHIESQILSNIIEKNYCTKCFDYDKIKFMPQFRYPMSGDYMWLRTDGSKKKLNRILIDSKIPISERNRLWVLAEGNHILWIPAIGRCSAYYYVTDVTKEILCVTASMEEEKSGNGRDNT